LLLVIGPGPVATGPGGHPPPRWAGIRVIRARAPGARSILGTGT